MKHWRRPKTTWPPQCCGQEMTQRDQGQGTFWSCAKCGDVYDPHNVTPPIKELHGFEFDLCDR